MNTIENSYNLGEVKKWIKKGKKPGARYMHCATNHIVTDTHIMLPVTPAMMPAMLEAFGTLESATTNGGTVSPHLADLARMITDIPVHHTRLLYDSGNAHYHLLKAENGRKIAIGDSYAKLFNRFPDMQLYVSNASNSPVYVARGDEWLGLIMPVNIGDGHARETIDKI